MDSWRILIGLNSTLLLVVAFFVRQWMARIREDTKKLETVIDDLRKLVDGKTDLTDCNHTHDGVDRLLHRHAASGTAGEAVYK
jgi:tetrahydromethanopterin S-methyltransferase subunit B